MASRITYIFYIILVISDINQYLCEPISDKLEKHSEFDLDGILNSFFPNFNQVGNNNNNNAGDNGGNSLSNNQNQANSPQGNSWNNANANPGINYPGNSQFYPGGHSQNNQLQYPGNTVNNGIYPGNSQQGNQQQYPGNTVNNGIYPGSTQQGNRPQYPGNVVNDGIYTGNPQQGNTNQRYPGNGINGMWQNNPRNPMQANNPQYPVNGLLNGNPNDRYPGNHNNFQGFNPQYTQGNGINNINTRPGTNYPSYPSDSNQGSNIQYPGTGNNWNDNRYPNHNQNVNAQTPFTGTNWNNVNGLQNNPDQVGVGNQQSQGFNQIPVIQGQPPRYPNVYQNYNRGLQNGFPSQSANGLNNQLNGNFQDPNGQYPQLAGIVTTENVDVLSNPAVATTTQLPPFTTSTLSSKKQCVQDCPTTSEYSPLCGSDNITYFNKGKFDCAIKCGIDVTIVRSGTCVPATGIKHQAGVYA